MPEEILKDLEIVFVENVDDVLPQALAAPREEIFSGQSREGRLSVSLRAKDGESGEEAGEKDD